MKRTLKRELKVLEIVKREAIGTSNAGQFDRSAWVAEAVVILSAMSKVSLAMSMTSGKSRTVL